MGTLQAPTDELTNEKQNETTEKHETTEELSQVQDPNRFEGKVTPEQELSASVSRRRRNISKKRSESAHRPRDVTPARDLLSENTNQDDEERNGTPKTPERKLRKTNSNNSNKENESSAKIPTKNNSEETNNTQNGENMEKAENKEEKIENDEVTTTVGKEEINSDLQSLLSKAKRSASNATKEKPARMKRDSKLLAKKRSQSTPRPASEENGTKEDLEEKKTRLKKEKELQECDKPKTEHTPLKETSPEKIEPEVEKSEIKQIIEDFNKAQKLSTPVEKIPDFVPSSEPIIESAASNQSEGKIKRRTQYAPAAQQYLERRRLEKALSQDKTTDEPKKSKKQPRMTFKELKYHWNKFKCDHPEECSKIKSMRNRCLNDIGLLMIFCGIGGLIFKFTEGAFENFYKCGVKRVKRDFIDILWKGSHNLREEDWKTLARTKLRDFEEQLHTAHEAGVHSYSGQRSWSFLNGIVYALTVVTTIGE